MNSTAFDLVSFLADVADLPMEVLGSLPDTVFGSVLADAVTPQGEPIAAFTSALG